jgi:hypothetical protein
MQASERMPDALKYVLYALIIPALGVVWVWVLRPFLSSFVWHLMEQKPEKQVELFFKAIEDEKQQPRLVRVSQKIFGDRITHVDSEIARAIGIGSDALALAQVNRDSMEFLKSSVLAQGTELQRIAETVGGISELSTAVQRVKNSIERLEGTANDNAVLLGRIEERQDGVYRTLEVIQRSVERRDGTLRDTGERRRDSDH